MAALSADSESIILMIGGATVRMKATAPARLRALQCRYQIRADFSASVGAPRGAEMRSARKVVRNSLPCGILIRGKLIPAFALGLIEASRQAGAISAVAVQSIPALSCRAAFKPAKKADIA